MRQAVPNDLDKLYELSVEAHQQSVYSHIPHDETWVKRAFAHAIVGGFAWVCDDLNGALLAIPTRLWFNPNVSAVTDLFFFVRPGSQGQGAALARKYLKWADSRGIEVYGLSVSSGVNMDRTERLYQCLGLTRIGGEFIMIGERHVKTG